ncbi:MAG: RsmD family RNA methyltransferase [Pirellulales bacterium]|nr:RsmD family RNA methyltransferase [Pirellulales bacterium]
MAKKRRQSKPQTTSRVDTPLRIIGGKYGGRKLAYSGDVRTRPMKQRVREAIFNLVGPAIKGKYALDLFAGTGALGLEAISRGAVGATFIERHYPTTDAIRETISAIGIAEPCEVIAADSFIWTRKHLTVDGLPTDAPWVVFISPPYDFFVDRQSDMLAQISRVIEVAPEDSRIVVESDKRFDTALLPEYLEWDVRTYPPATVGVAVKKLI